MLVFQDVVCSQAQPDMALLCERARNQLAQAALQQQPVRMTPTICQHCCPLAHIPLRRNPQTHLTCSRSQHFGREAIFSPQDTCHALHTGQWRTPGLREGFSHAARAPAQPAPRLGQETAGGKGHSYRARGGGKELHCDWEVGQREEGVNDPELLSSG